MSESAEYATLLAEKAKYTQLLQQKLRLQQELQAQQMATLEQLQEQEKLQQQHTKYQQHADMARAQQKHLQRQLCSLRELLPDDKTPRDFDQGDDNEGWEENEEAPVEDEEEETKLRLALKKAGDYVRKYNTFNQGDDDKGGGEDDVDGEAEEEDDDDDAETAAAKAAYLRHRDPTAEEEEEEEEYESDFEEFGDHGEEGVGGNTAKGTRAYQENAKRLVDEQFKDERQKQRAQGGSDLSVPISEVELVTWTGGLLVLISTLKKKGALTPQAWNTLKDCVLEFHPMLLDAFRMYLLNDDTDLLFTALQEVVNEAAAGDAGREDGDKQDSEEETAYEDADDDGNYEGIRDVDHDDEEEQEGGEEEEEKEKEKEDNGDEEQEYKREVQKMIKAERMKFLEAQQQKQVQDSAATDALEHDLPFSADEILLMGRSLQFMGFQNLTPFDLLQPFISFGLVDMITEEEYFKCILFVQKNMRSNNDWFIQMADYIFQMSRNEEGSVEAIDVLAGLSIFCKGTVGQKLEFSFKLFDLNKQGNVQGEVVIRYAHACSVSLQALVMVAKKMHDTESDIEALKMERDRLKAVVDGKSIFGPSQIKLSKDGTVNLLNFLEWDRNPVQIVDALFGELWAGTEGEEDDDDDEKGEEGEEREDENEEDEEIEENEY